MCIKYSKPEEILMCSLVGRKESESSNEWWGEKKEWDEIRCVDGQMMKKSLIGQIRIFIFIYFWWKLELRGI